MKKLLSTLSILVILGIVVSACGGIGAGKFPTGTFVRPGEEDYGFKFNKDGTFEVFSGDSTLVSGTYTADDKTFTETSSDSGCNSQISFSYVFDGTSLTFQYVGDPLEDSCSGRQADFNNQTYKLAD